MQTPCRFLLELISVSLPPGTKGDVRLGLERGNKSACTKIYKCSPVVIVNQNLSLSTTIKQHDDGAVQHKNVSLRLFLRDQNSKLSKYRLDIDISQYVGKAETEVGLSFPQAGATALFKGTLVFQVLELQGEKPNLVQKGMKATVQCRQHNTPEKSQTKQTGGGSGIQTVDKQYPASVQGLLKRKIDQLETERENLCRQIAFQRKLNSERLQCKAVKFACENPVCSSQNQRPQEQLSQIGQNCSSKEMQKLRAVCLTQAQTITQLRSEVQSALQSSQETKKLQALMARLEQNHIGLQRQLKESKRFLEIKIQELSRKDIDLSSFQTELVRSKMETMSIWDSILQIGGPALFDLISADYQQ